MESTKRSFDSLVNFARKCFHHAILASSVRREKSEYRSIMASCPPRSGSNMSFLNIEYKPNYAVVTLKREPVNTMNLSMWKQLLDTLDTLEKDPKVRGVIFISGIQRDVFTAGNDILELYAPKTSQERYRYLIYTALCRV